jgi:hypothetical protein
MTDMNRTPHQGSLTQGEVDAAIAEATEDLFTQEQLDAGCRDRGGRNVHPGRVRRGIR